MANSRRMVGPSLAVHMKDGRVYLTFDREAESREDAIDSALRNIATAGYSYEETKVPQVG